FDGIPLKKHKVDYKLIIKDYTWYYNNPKYTVSGDTLTDENGCFEITVNASELSEYKTVQCQIIATITNQSGETQNKEYYFFVTDNTHMINISGSDYYNIKDSCYNFVAYTSSFFSSSKQETGIWKLLNDKNDIVSKGSWTPGSNNKIHNSWGMNTGKYRLICELGDKSITQKDIIFFNPHSGRSPVDSTLMIIPYMNNSIFVGTTETKVYIRYLWQDSKGTSDEKWITLNKGLHKWNLPVVEKGEEARLTLITVKDCKMYSATHAIKNEIETDSIKIDIQTFRNHLTPGAKDEWTLLLTKNGKPLNDASTLAFMFDESLLSIGNFNPQLKVKKDTDYCFSGEFIPSASFGESTLSCIDESLVRKTYLNNDTYLHWNIRRNLQGINYYPYTRSIKYDINRFDYFWREYSPANLESDLIDNLTNKTIRSNFADCAFFYPNLPVNKDGKVTFSFTLPDLITTWRFVAITNNEKMEVGQIQQSFVAQKELMLQINEPRFLRQGDQTEIEATVSFLKPHSGATTVTMELVDATTEKVITSTEKQISGSEQVLKVNFPLTVPANTDRIILRMRASNGNFSDGEQYLIPVLSPDIELTQTLELNTGGNSDRKFQWKALNQKELENSNSKFRIELVKNPAWYTINALSALLNPNSASSDALINAYFANTLGEAIAKANPDIETYLIEKAKSP
ncbi:MAG: alpha-2-macroglobulin family protein, partial [Bacteroidales bacterium]